jgi:GNAT superfamily N-acetyltransferase
MILTDVLRSQGQHLPAGHELATLAERPDQLRAVERFGSSVWPEFMLKDAVSDRLWPRLADELPEYQLALLDDAGAMAAVGRSLPLAWDGSLDDLPPGWDAQFERSFEDLARGVVPNALGAIMIVTDPVRRGEGLGSLMVSALLSLARLHGLRALIACVRPTLLERYPLTPVDAYAQWMRADGLPFDPWLRIHVRLGGRLSRPEPASMRISGTVREWESWTGLVLPASGRYIVPGACAPVEIDREADTGTYLDPNVWVIHDLA